MLGDSYLEDPSGLPLPNLPWPYVAIVCLFGLCMVGRYAYYLLIAKQQPGESLENPDDTDINGGFP